MLKILFGLTARLPLRVHHAVGALAGWLAYLFSPVYAMRLRENLALSGVCADAKEFSRLVSRNIAESGKGLAELVVVWFRPVEAVRALVTKVTGLEVVSDAERNGRGIIYITPHLGCFDVAALYLAARAPITVLYRPAKKPWLQGTVDAGRERDQISLAPTNLQGVKRLLKALKRGETIGILPDQAPSAGEGEWANFFGRPAYTMTLVGRLARSTGAAVILVCAERLPRGVGYHLYFQKLASPLTGQAGARQLNLAIEQLILRCPAQYLWSYNRFKAPPGVAPPSAC
jgi:Kdo2-lipid IVA lauroyltransferase/acyltransferase